MFRNKISGAAVVHKGKLFAQGSAFDQNDGSGVYVCGVPIVPIDAKERETGFAFTVSPGAEAQLSGCRARCNLGNGVYAVQRAVLTAKKSSFNENQESGVRVSNSRAEVQSCKSFSNGRHGIGVDNQGACNVSHCNLTNNTGDGVGAFDMGTEARIVNGSIDQNWIGIASNHNAEVIVVGKGPDLMNNRYPLVEAHGGKVFNEIRDINPLFDHPACSTATYLEETSEPSAEPFKNPSGLQDWKINERFLDDQGREEESEPEPSRLELQGEQVVLGEDSNDWSEYGDGID